MTEPYRILVTGSRDWDDTEGLRFALIRVWAPRHRLPVVVVHGACPTGADAMAAEWAHDYGVRAEEHPADWDQFGKAAGPKRNAEMVAAGAQVCLAFIRNDSRGATHCAGLAEQAGIEVRRYLLPSAVRAS
jgi:hypothetical protein